LDKIHIFFFHFLLSKTDSIKHLKLFKADAFIVQNEKVPFVKLFLKEKITSSTFTSVSPNKK